MEAATGAREPVARATASPLGGVASYVAELIGTFALVFLVTMIVVIHSGDGIGVTDWAVIGLVHAFILMLLVASLGGASGAHFNPAVTLALLVGRKIRPSDAVIYILMQLVGGVLAALLTKALLEDEGRTLDYGLTSIADAPEAPPAQPGAPPPPAQGADFLGGAPFAGFVVEAIATFLLMWAIMATAVNPRGDRQWAPFVIGATLGLAVMVFGPLTGGALNPARWFGPAVAGGEFGDFWVYILGPIAGAVLAYILYSAIVLAPQRREPGERPIDKLD